MEKNNNKYVSKTTVGNFYAWYYGNYNSNEPVDKSIINRDNCEDLAETNWFDIFDDEDMEKNIDDVENFLKENWDREIEIVSTNCCATWDVSFNLDGVEYTCNAIDYFGAELN